MKNGINLVKLLVKTKTLANISATDICKPLVSSVRYYLQDEITWEKYMGDFKEVSEINECDEQELHKMPILQVDNYDYNHKLSILNSKLKFGNPTLDVLGSLLSKHCLEIEALRGKPNIGYYAHSGPEAAGYVSIDSEDLSNIEAVILDTCDDATIVDFILSSPGGQIEASLKL